jgi:hypothetical protein
MAVDTAMLAMFYAVLVVPMLWALRPARMDTPY